MEDDMNLTTGSAWSRLRGNEDTISISLTFEYKSVTETSQTEIAPIELESDRGIEALKHHLLTCFDEQVKYFQSREKK